MRTLTSLVVLSERTTLVLTAIRASFFELRSLIAASCHPVPLGFISCFPIGADGSSPEQDAVFKRQGSFWQGGFLVPCLERGESQ